MKASLRPEHRPDLQRLYVSQIDEVYREAYTKICDPYTSIDAKISAGRIAMRQLLLLAENPLSMPNLANAMYAAVRLRLRCAKSTHPSFKENTITKKSEPNLGQNELLASLLPRFMEGLRKDTGVGFSPTARTGAATARAISSVLYVCSLSPTSLDYERLSHVRAPSPVFQATHRDQDADEVEATCLPESWNTKSILHLSLEDIDVMASKFLDVQKYWNKESVINTTGALGRLRAFPLEGRLHKALQAASAPVLPELGYKTSTLMWGFARSGYCPGSEFIHKALTQVMKDQEGLHRWSQAAVDSLLYSLVSFGYSPRVPVVMEHVTPNILQEDGQDSADHQRKGSAMADGNKTAMVNGRHLVQDINRGRPGSLKKMNDSVHRSRNCFGYKTKKETLERIIDDEQSSAWYIGEMGRTARRDKTSSLAKEIDEILLSITREIDGVDAPSNNTWLKASKHGQEWDVDCSMQKDPSTRDLVTALLQPVEPKHHQEGMTPDSASALISVACLSEDIESDALMEDAAMYEHDGMPRLIHFGNTTFEQSFEPDTGRTVITPYYEPSVAALKSWKPVPGPGPTSDDAREDKRVSSTSGIACLAGSVDQPAELTIQVPSESLTSSDSVQERYRESSAYGSVAEGDSAPDEAGDAVGNQGEVAAAAVAGLISQGVASATSIKSLARFVWYSGALGHYKPSVFNEAASKIAESDELLQQLCREPVAALDLLQGYAHHAEPLPHKVIAAACEAIKDGVEMESVPISSLSWLAWSLAAMGQLDADTLSLVASKIAASKEFAIGLNERYLNMIFQAALQLEVATGRSHLELLPKKLHDVARSTWRRRDRRLNTSTMQRQVAHVLRSLGFRCQLEYQPPKSHVIIDIAVLNVSPLCANAVGQDKIGGGSGEGHQGLDSDLSPSQFAQEFRPIAVEVDGPFHFATNAPTRPMGALRMRDALLEHSGWPVVNIPYWEWNNAGKTEEGRKAYLKRKLLERFEKL